MGGRAAAYRRKILQMTRQARYVRDCSSATRAAVPGDSFSLGTAAQVARLPIHEEQGRN
jgi:hypothetical protein